MHQYEPKKFNVPALDGISAKSVEEHIGLYEGYVKNLNAITSSMWELLKDPEKNMHAIAELARRRSFEFDGMRLHELYFPQFEGAPTEFAPDSSFVKALEKTYGTVEMAMNAVRQVGMMRGPGWSLLYYDKEGGTFQLGFSGEQHQGHFVSLPVVLALDVWEHAFLLDYGAQGKGKYIDAFFKNLNWEVVISRFDAIVA